MGDGWDGRAGGLEMQVVTNEIVLRGGPADGEVHGEVPAGCTIYAPLAKHPDARYLDTGTTDGPGRRVFEYSPPAGAVEHR